MKLWRDTNSTQERIKSIDCYVDSLKMNVKSCNFCDCISLKDSLICDRLVLGVYDLNTRARLLSTESRAHRPSS